MSFSLELQPTKVRKLSAKIWFWSFSVGRREKQKQDDDLFAFSPSNQEVLQYRDCVKSYVNGESHIWVALVCSYGVCLCGWV